MARADHLAVDPPGDPHRGVARHDPDHGLVEQCQAVGQPPLRDLDAPRQDRSQRRQDRSQRRQVRIAARVAQTVRPAGGRERGGMVAAVQLLLRLQQQQIPALWALRVRPGKAAGALDPAAG
ncbi:MAG TPA: hypothetical protein VK891_11345, partial [Euzebyales bacterium]|nr:hypothetical protein [Euzebyales bacterium]